MKKLLFVGEERSQKAVQMGVTWKDGRLAAKQLFDALAEVGIQPADCEFVNLFEPDGLQAVRRLQGEFQIVGMGRKVGKALYRAGIGHLPLVHPAARGTIRLKANYAAHVRKALEGRE